MSKITLAEAVLTSAKTEMGLQNSFNRTSSVEGNSDSRHLVAIRRSLGQQRILNRKSEYNELERNVAKYL